MLDRATILACGNLAPAPVSVPEWGERSVVYVRSLTGLEADGFRDADKRPNFLGSFAALVLCDAEGQRLFSDADAELLGQKPLRVLTRICDAAQRHNGMTAAAQEELEKNSARIRAANSGSISPEN